MTIGSALRNTGRRLADAGIDTASREASWLVQHVLGVDRAVLLAHPERPLTAQESARLETLVVRRARREPLQYLLGHADFFGRRFDVTPHVLIPRPETEELVQAVLDRLQGGSVLDAGTGSGCIACTIALERPECDVAGFDISPEALSVARANGHRLGAVVRWFEADYSDVPAVAAHVAACDLLVSNPPYVPESEAETLEPELAFEPTGALFELGDALRPYHALAALAHAIVRSGGWLAAEVHAPHADDVSRIFVRADLAEVTLLNDLSGRPRFALARRR